MTLSPDHLHQLTQGSGIDEAIVQRVGCYTATTPAQLVALGYKEYQRCVPALVLPVHDVHGNVALHQIRPDTPRKNKQGKILKYDTPEGAKLVLAVALEHRPLLTQADVPLLVIEGLKKKWSVDSRLEPDVPLCTVGVIGTEGWRRGGRPLPDWQAIKLPTRNILIVYDSDATSVKEVGAARKALAQFLQSAGAYVQHVDFPALPGAKCGADDFLVQGHSLQDLLALAQETFPQPKPLLINAADVVKEALTYLWWPYLPFKMVSMLDGDPDVGKTGMACMLSSSVSQGFPLPDQTGKPTLRPDGPGHVLMVAMEDVLGAVVIPRLEKCGADLTKITFLNERTDERQEPQPFTLADLPLLSTYMERTRPRLVYIDAIQAVLGAKVDTNRANVVTALLGPLRKLAEQYNCVVLCSRHPAKGGQNVAKILYRGMGSQAFIGTARSGLFIEEHPDDRTKSLLVHYKSNTGDKGCTHLFSKAGGHFEWCGTTRVGHDILAGDGGPGPLPTQRVKACLWLEQQLQGGKNLPASKLYTEADEKHSWSQKVVRSASEYLKVTKTQIPGDFLWSLPPMKVDQGGTGASGVSGASGASGVSGVDSPNLEETPLAQDILSCNNQSTQDTQDTQDHQDTPDHPDLSWSVAQKTAGPNGATTLGPLCATAPSLCPHKETHDTTYPDGSVLRRCVVCHAIVVVNPQHGGQD
jgi:DNA repair protein RadA/Sms